MTVSFQSGFGAFGNAPGGGIPTIMSPSAATPDWIVQYVQAGKLPIRLRSIMLQALRPTAGTSPPGSLGVPYFIAIGPMPQAAQLQAGQALVPAALFANTVTPFTPPLQAFSGSQFICMEAGVASMNPWIPRTWSPKEIAALGEGFMVIVAAATPIDLSAAGTPLLQNSLLFMTVLGEDDAQTAKRTQIESSLARYGIAL